MTHNNLQKTLSRFILREGGGKWLGELSGLPVPSVLLALDALADGQGRVECTQSEIAEGLAMGRRTVSKCFVFMKAKELVKSVRRGVYSLVSYESLTVMRSQCAQVAVMSTECAQVVETGETLTVMSTECAQVDEAEQGLTIYKETISKEIVSSAQARATTTTFKEKQQKIARLEKIVTRNIGAQAWNQSTSWHEMLERARWDMDVLTDAIVAYADKVTGSGQKHQFSRLYNFVVRELESRQRRAAMQTQARPNYNPRPLVSEGARITENEMQDLKGFFNV